MIARLSIQLMLSRSKHENAIYVEGRLPSANEMSALAFDKYKNNDIEDVAYFEPYYLKDFIALKPKA